MPLTPADVHNATFKKPSIGKRGYDEDEVDQFLDQVETELGRLIEENNGLSARIAQYETGGAPPAEGTAAPTSTAEAHTQAARLLALAQETADRLTAEAREESERLMAEAREKSEAAMTDATEQAKALEEDSRTRAEALDQDARNRYEQALGNLNTEQTGLQQQIDELRTYEQEYRGRLKSWISEQLAQLDHPNPKVQAPAAAAPAAAPVAE